MQVTEILTDHTLMALDLQGSPEDPIRFFLDRIDQFDRAGIHWHWHPEVEFNVILRGRMEYYVENEHHTLAAGQGIFKNANILHMAQPARETPDAEMFSVILDPSFIAPVQSVIYRKYIAPFLGSQGCGAWSFPRRCPGSRPAWTPCAGPTRCTRPRPAPMSCTSTGCCARCGRPWPSTPRSCPATT